MSKIIKSAIWIIIIGALSVAAYLKLGENKEKITAQANLAAQTTTDIPVTTAVVTNQTLNGNFDITGAFQPYKQVSVISDVQGKVTSLKVNNGDFVSEGSTILTVDNELINNELNVSQLNLKKAENDLSRLRNLLGEGGVTQQQIDDAQIQIENLKSRIVAGEKQLRTSTVKAPISGTVSGKRIERGSFIAPGTPIFEIVNVQRLKMTVSLNEGQVATVRKGQKVKVLSDLYPNKTFYGTVSFIDIKSDASKRFPVEIEIANDGQLKAGMSGKAYFESGRSTTVMAIPRESFVGSLRDAKVFVVENNIAKLKSVKLGEIFGEQVEVLGGLKVGDVVVNSGQINLQDGSKIVAN